MSSSINKVFLVGNAGRDPEIRQVGDAQVAQFSLATSVGGYKKNDGTDVPKTTQWHTIVAWRQLVEPCKYIHKGDRVIVAGEIVYREYADPKTGEIRRVTDILARDIIPPTKQSSVGYRPQLTAADAPFSTETIRNAMPATPAPSGVIPGQTIYAKDIDAASASPVDYRPAVEEVRRAATSQVPPSQLDFDLPF